MKTFLVILTYNNTNLYNNNCDNYQGFPEATVAGHFGELVFGLLGISIIYYRHYDY